MREIEIHEIEGFKIGHAQDEEGATGCTVVICEKGAFAGVDVRGSGPASRETELLKPSSTVDRIHAVMLSGGSAYGLAAGDGAMRFLEEKGVGFPVGVGVVPIVCGASLFDLVVGKADSRPDADMGYSACRAAGRGPLEEGNVGAGTGASVGKYLGLDRMMKCGFGTHAVQMGELKCGAMVAVNALGDIIDYDTNKPIAGLLSRDKCSVASTKEVMYEEITRQRDVFTGNTTIGCILTNAEISKVQAGKIASVAHNGLARTISPVHTSVDGDTVFALGTGQVPVNMDALALLAGETMARAINRAARKARSAYGLKSAADFAVNQK